MISQLELLPEKAPRVTENEIREMCGLLRARGWVIARDILRLRPGWNERKIRAIASRSGGRVISHPGSPGYRLAEQATVAELWRCRNAHHHQMDEHARRITEIDRVIHERAGEL